MLESARQDLEAQRRDVQTERAAQQAAAVTHGRDPETGATVVRGHWVALGVTHGLRRGQQWQMSFDRGTEAVRSVQWALQTRGTGGIYRSALQMILVVDGRELALPVVDYKSKVRSSGGRRRTRRDEETVWGTVSVDDLRTVASASAATGRIGTTRFRVTDEQRRIFRALLREIDGSGAAVGGAPTR